MNPLSFQTSVVKRDQDELNGIFRRVLKEYLDDNLENLIFSIVILIKPKIIYLDYIIKCIPIKFKPKMNLLYLVLKSMIYLFALY